MVYHDSVIFLFLIHDKMKRLADSSCLLAEYADISTKYIKLNTQTI